MTRARIASTFMQELDEIPGAETMRLCMQCGTCTASCPNVDYMEHTPSELIAMTRADLREDVLKSNTMWYCLSCYMCTARCPRGVKITEVMHSLGYMSVQAGLVHPGTLTPTMYRLFNHLCSIGTLPELMFMARFYIQTNPFRAFRMLPVAYNLLKHGRLSLETRKLTPGGANQLKTILKTAESLGGAR